MRLTSFAYTAAALLRLVLLASSTAVVTTDATSDGSLQALYALVERRMPAHKDSFVFNLNAADDNALDSFTVTDLRKSAFSLSLASGPFIQIDCNTKSACSRGLYTYLEKVGKVGFYWTGSRLGSLAYPPPLVGSTPLVGSAAVKYRYALNTVTYGYTMAFWGWQEWEDFLDWLALHGNNLVIAWVGFEAVLTEVFLEFGLSQADIDSFVSCAPFHPWNRFGNIQGSWNGPCPSQWIDDQVSLQQLILSRMVGLGITPILPVFPGFVPMNFTSIYPNASVALAPQWEGFPRQYTNDSFLDPTDVMSAQIQKSFMTKYQETFGEYGVNATHFYTLDQFNEINPQNLTLPYLQSVSSSNLANIRAVDPNGIIVEQTWLFFSSPTIWTPDRVEAYLSGYPTSSDCNSANISLLLLDLYSEANELYTQFNQYYDHCYVWNVLHDYGGNMGLQGNLNNLTTVPIQALQAANSTMNGMGFTPEGLEGNEIVYNLLLEQAWSNTSLDVGTYVQEYIEARYNLNSLPNTVSEAWEILQNTVYSDNDTSSLAVVKSIIGLNPGITGLANLTGHHPTKLFYNTSTSIVPAIELLLLSMLEAPQLAEQPEFQYDVVDLARQLLDNIFLDFYNTLIELYNSPSCTVEELSTIGTQMLEVIADLDTLLYTNENFLLSNWISNATSWASVSGAAQNLNVTLSVESFPGLDVNETYAAYLEYNARNQITLWGPTGNIANYASKDWAGLMGTFYYPRWFLWLSYLYDTQSDGGVNSYNTTYVSEFILDMGIDWGNQRWGTVPGQLWGTSGDVWEVVDYVVEKWIRFA